MSTYTLADFDGVPSAKEIVYGNVDVGQLPTVEEVKTLARWTPDVLSLFEQPAEHFSGETDGEKKDRSAAMARLAYFGAELGWEDPQITAVLYDADDRWGKYVHRRDREKRILDFVNRARAKHGYNYDKVPDFSLIDTKKFTVVDADKNEKPLIYGFDDFSKADFPINWMLEDLLSEGGVGLVTGFPGTGKTQFGIAMGAHLALGAEKFLRWDNPNGHKKILFLSLEMGAAPLNLFLRTIGRGYDDMHTLNKNFLVGPFGEPLPLDTPQGQAFLNSILDEYMPDVIFIDSLQAVISKEMTDELSVKSFFHYLSSVREKYRCGMVVIHHNRKKPNDAQKKSVELSDVYGSTFIAAEVDWVLSLRLTDPTDSSVLSVDMLKNRLGKTIAPFEMYRDENLGFSTEFSHLMNTPTKEGSILDV